MADPQKRGNRWRMQVCVDLTRKSKTFKTRREAVAWGLEQEDSGILPNKLLSDAIEKYRPIAEKMKGSKSQLSRLKTIEAHRIASVRLENLTKAHISEFRDDRSKAVSDGTLRVEMSILSTILKHCRDDWGWMVKNPSESVTKPPAPPARRRGISQTEIDQITQNLSRSRHCKVILDAFLLSIETGMRLGEITRIRWEDVSEKTVFLGRTKNGDKRTIPLSQKARDILAYRRNICPDRPFDTDSTKISQLFRYYSVSGVHFHDARSEAITRMSKKLDIMDLARVIGHRDLRSLLFYYHANVEDMADKL